MPRISLRPHRHRQYAERKGWRTHKSEALALGMSPTTVSRVVSGATAPGTQFIAALLTMAEPDGLRFDDFFEVIHQQDRVA